MVDFSAITYIWYILYTKRIVKVFSQKLHLLKYLCNVSNVGTLSLIKNYFCLARKIFFSFHHADENHQFLYSNLIKNEI